MTSPLTPQQDQRLRDVHYTTAVAIPSPVVEGERVPLHVWCAWMTGAMKALAAAVANADEATRDRLSLDFQVLRERIGQLPHELAVVIGDQDPPEELAALLRPALGSKAQRVGELLAGGG